MSTVPSLLSGLSPWIAGVIGGLSANIAANWLWRKYTKPELVFGDTANTDFEVDNDGSPEARRFKIVVRNEGRTAAKNCKPKIQLQGKHEGSLYEVERTVCWAEEGHPSRITINPDETAEFEFFKITAEQENDEEVLNTNLAFYAQFPDSAGEDSTGDVVEWLYDDEFAQVQGAEFHDKIEKELFEKLEWQTNEIVVTSENTDRIDGFVTLNPDIKDAQGLVGMTVSVIPN
ncbi:hypothetical protein [Halomicrococcus sp. NG-SE-24]|uniref:hypothetical protein n=1 Tax=Halomicrococcus sp. NG-SE-24 TaxID=3436928 RepID=UPI003D954B9B